MFDSPYTASRVLFTVCSLALSGTLLVQPRAMAAGSEKVSANVRIDTDAEMVHYDPMIFGGFIEHFHRQIYGGIFEPGSPLSDERGFRVDVIEALKELNMPVVRWPGGCFVSAYHWLDGVGPERTPAYDKAWRVEDPNTFGTDEFVLWCKAVGTEPYIAVNAGTGTIEEMSDWVEYCNQTLGKWARLRKANGFPEPHGVKYWSIGNENWGLHEPGTKTKEEWPILVREAAQLMQAVDPNIKLFAPALDTEEWTVPLIEIAGHRLDYISIHGYWTWGYPPANYMACMRRAERPEEKIVRTVEMIKNSRHKRRIRIAFDEWNTRGWHHPNAPDRRVSPADIAARDLNDRNSDYTMADAVFSAGLLNACLRHADFVTMANISPIVNTRGPLFVHPEGIVKRTTFHVTKMYANQLASHVAKAEITSDPPMGGRSKVAPVDAVATCDADRKNWRIALINRHPEQDADVRIHLGDRPVTGRHAATVLSGDSPDAYNGIEQPNRVVPEQVELSFTNGAVQLPPHSVTIVEVAIP
jgi:alpha-N-arabinofuranosidase